MALRAAHPPPSPPGGRGRRGEPGAPQHPGARGRSARRACSPPCGSAGLRACPAPQFCQAPCPSHASARFCDHPTALLGSVPVPAALPGSRTILQLCQAPCPSHPIPSCSSALLHARPVLQLRRAPCPFCPMTLPGSVPIPARSSAGGGQSPARTTQCGWYITASPSGVQERGFRERLLHGELPEIFIYPDSSAFYLKRLQVQFQINCSSRAGAARIILHSAWGTLTKAGAVLSQSRNYSNFAQQLKTLLLSEA